MQRSALLYQRLAMLCQRCRFFAEHPFTRTRRIHQYTVKKFRQSLF